MAYVPTLEDTQEFLAENELQQQLRSKKEPVDNSSGTFNFLKGLGVGAAESLANFGPSVANVALGPIDYVAGTNMSLPYWNFEKYRPKTTGGNIGHIAGNIAGMLAPGSTMTKAFTKLLGSPGVLKTAAATAAGNASVSGGEDELFRRGLASVTGLIPLLQGLRAKPIVAKAVERNKELGKHFKTEYETFFNKAESALPKDEALRVPKIINSKSGTNALSEIPGVKKALKGFTLEPTLRNAHRAQSDIGKAVRKFEGKTRGRTLPGYQSEALSTAEKIQNNIQAAMKDAFVKHGQKGLSDEYSALSNEYRKRMVPYLEDALKEHIYNPKGTPAKKVLEAMKKRKGQVGKGEYYNDLPGFKYKENADIILPPLLKAGAAGTGVGAGWKLLSEMLKND